MVKCKFCLSGICQLDIQDSVWMMVTEPEGEAFGGPFQNKTILLTGLKTRLTIIIILMLTRPRNCSSLVWVKKNNMHVHACTHTRTCMHARTKNIIVKWIQAMHHFCDSSLLAGTVALPRPQIWVETDQRWKITYMWLRMRLMELSPAAFQPILCVQTLCHSLWSSTALYMLSIICIRIKQTLSLTLQQ